MSKKYVLKIKYIDPYTWEVEETERIISICSKEAALKWAKQSYYKAFSVTIKKMLT